MWIILNVKSNNKFDQSLDNEFEYLMILAT